MACQYSKDHNSFIFQLLWALLWAKYLFWCPLQLSFKGQTSIHAPRTSNQEGHLCTKLDQDLFDLMPCLIFSGFSSTCQASHFFIKHPFELILFALSSLPWKEHLAQEKSQNARGNFIWPQLEQGDLNSALCRDLKIANVCKLKWDHFAHVQTFLWWWNTFGTMQNDLKCSTSHTYRANSSHTWI